MPCGLIRFLKQSWDILKDSRNARFRAWKHLKTLSYIHASEIWKQFVLTENRCSATVIYVTMDVEYLTGIFLLSYIFSVGLKRILWHVYVYVSAQERKSNSSFRISFSFHRDVYDILKREKCIYRLTSEKGKDRACNRSQPAFSALMVSGSSPFGYLRVPKAVM